MISLAWGSLGLALLLAANGLFVTGEVGVLEVPKSVASDLEARGVRNARVLRRLLDRSDELRSLLVLGASVSSLGVGALAGLLLARGDSPRGPSLLSTSFFAGAVVLLHVALVHTLPRALAKARTERLALAVAPPLSLLLAVGGPLLLPALRLGRRLLRPLGLGAESMGRTAHSETELRMLVEESHEGGELESEEREMIQNVFDLSDTRVREIMTPIVDVVSVRVDAPLSEIAELVALHQHSRLPVYEERFDKIVGVLHVKDLVSRLGSLPADFDLRPILHETHFVPETKHVDELLTEFRRLRVQAALVTDEYGNLAGLVTLEDVLEEIVGEIEDEFDEEELAGRQTEDGAAVVDGLLRIDDFNRRFGTSLASENALTIGGVVTERLQRIARQGDRLSVLGHELRVRTMDGYRVGTLLVRALREGERTADGGAEAAGAPEDASSRGASRNPMRSGAPLG